MRAWPICSLPAMALIAALAVPSRGQAEDIVFRCFFDWVCDPNTKCRDTAEDIRFRINTQANSVSRIGGNDLSQFNLIVGDRAITVLETPISGGTTTTTILVGDGSAVHSENRINGRDLAPMQYLGSCNAS